MRTHALVDRRGASSSLAECGGHDRGGAVGAMLALQRTAGNRAVSRLVAGRRRLDREPKSAGDGWTIHPEAQRFLEGKLKALYEAIPRRDRIDLKANGTVAIGMADVDGDVRLVYTVNGNRGSRAFHAAAERLDLHRWRYDSGVKGRGSVGAPNDAEQLLFGFSEDHHARLYAAVVSRRLCEDCATVVEGHGGRVRVVVVPDLADLPNPRQPLTKATPPAQTVSGEIDTKPPTVKPPIVKPPATDPPTVRSPATEPSAAEPTVVKPPPVEPPSRPPVPEVDVEGAGLADHIAAGMTVFNLLLMLGRMIPDPEEADRINRAFVDEMQSATAQARLRELQPVIDNWSGDVYYVIRCNLVYYAHQSPKPQAFGNSFGLTGVEIVAIDLLPIPYQEEGDLEPEHKPSDAHPIWGGGYEWTARKQVVVSSKASRRRVAHH